MAETNCAEKFPDDPGVLHQTVLFRRIPPWHFVTDGTGKKRPSSAAFEDDRDGDPMSVYVSAIIEAEGRSPGSVIVGHPGFALAGIPAGLARERGQTVHPDGRDDTAHGVVCGKKTDSVRRAFAKQCIWVIEPTA
jgi:hypothetical protein